MPQGGHSAGQGRSSKKDGSKKTPSSVPLTAAAINAAVTTPGDSAVTQQSRPRSHSYGSKHVVSQSVHGSTNENSVPRKWTKKASELSPVQTLPNVFEFLERDDSDDAVRPTGAPEKSEQAVNLARNVTSPPKRSKERKPSASHSFYSDSGISIRDNSPDRASSVASKESTDYQPVTPPNLSLATVNWKRPDDSRTRPELQMAGAYITDSETVLESPTSAPVFFDMSSPESFYLPSRQVRPCPSDPTKSQCGGLHQACLDIKGLKSAENSRRWSSCSESLTSKSPSFKSESQAPPRIYRKFEALNHRVLLHLQEDIAQMEEDLASLDEYETMQRASNARIYGRQNPRRYDSLPEEHPSLHQRKLDLIERILMKTEQYNRGLCSFNKVAQTLPYPSKRDFESYKTWVQDHPFTANPAARLLDQDADLILLPTHPWGGPSANPVFPTIAAVAVAILLPLLAFGSIPQFFGRIILVAIVGGATALFASNASLGARYLTYPRDGWKCAGFYFGFMFVAALLF